MSFVCRPHKILLLWLISAMILFLIGAAPVFAGDPFGFSSSWNYQKNGGDTGASSQFNESYNLTYSKELSAAMTFSGSVRYSQNHPSAGDDSNSLNPNLSLDLRNDLFALNLNASESTSSRDGAPTRTDDSWGLNLNSQVDGWPSLRLYFNQSTATDDGTPKQSDSDVMTVGASTEYSFEHVDLLYDLRHSQSSDHVQNSDNETLDQTAQVSYDQNFMQGRISVSASQQFQMTENNTETRVGVGNAYFVDVNAVTGFYAVDNSPTLGFLATQPDLVDGDLVSPTAIDIFASTDMQNIGVQVNFQTTTRLEVFLDQQLTLTQQSLLSWQAYRSDDGNNWTLLGGAVTYPLENSRTVVTIDLPTPLTARYVKVVSDATLASATPVFVTELQASEERVATTNVVSLSRESKSLQTQFNTSVRLTDHWSISYSLRRAETRQDIGDTVQFNHSLTSSYNPSEKLGFAVGVSENSDEADNSPGRRNRSYSVSMSMLPLPTLSLSLGYTRSESQSDDGQDTLSDSISSSLNATIYPDLTASLAANWSRSKDLAEGTESNSYGLTLNTTAYLTPQSI
ncbi:MAG: hypothetical protein GXP51_00785 [Deltaproteobacteria bacterium]|nr:hypothetical protein [Deltaproteobacteria bacterium]